MMPTTRKKWRKAEDGNGALEECTSDFTLNDLGSRLASHLDWDLAFPDDERDANPTTFKFFQAAQAWAAQRGAAGAGGGLSYDMPDSDEEDEEDGEDGGGEDGENELGGADGEGSDLAAGADGEDVEQEGMDEDD